jgi:hypothetical protein
LPFDNVTLPHAQVLDSLDVHNLHCLVELWQLQRRLECFDDCLALIIVFP